ncbi:MAG: 30S ribosomal protein S9 [Gemmataceae bacterium]
MVADTKTKKNNYLGTGRRKTSVARVRLSEGNGQIVINGRGLDEYFTEEKDRHSVTAPLEITEMRNRLDVSVKVNGGGITGQAGAVSQGVARALKQMFGLTTSQQEGADGADHVSSMAKKLRDSHFLTRDSRMKERKKYGRKGARKSFQFSKR